MSRVTLNSPLWVRKTWLDKRDWVKASTVCRSRPESATRWELGKAVRELASKPPLGRAKVGGTNGGKQPVETGSQPVGSASPSPEKLDTPAGKAGNFPTRDTLSFRRCTKNSTNSMFQPAFPIQSTIRLPAASKMAQSPSLSFRRANAKKTGGFGFLHMPLLNASTTSLNPLQYQPNQPLQAPSHLSSRPLASMWEY